LKQLQLIQILRINAGSVAAVADVAANLRAVNRRWQAQDAAKVLSRNAASAFQARQNHKSRGLSLYAALTLLSFACIFPRKRAAWQSRGRRACMPSKQSQEKEIRMKRLIRILPAALAVMLAGVHAQEKINPTDPQPTCTMCPGTYIPAAEIDGYAQKALAEKLLDQQVRDIDIGKAHIGIGRVHRGKLDKPAPDSVAEHDEISEVYHVISGSATLVLGPDIVNRQRRPATMRTVVEYNGPGNNGSEVRGGVAYEIKEGDVVVIPAGTGHWFTKIDDHIDYLMVRIDPDKVTPLKSEAQSKEYLSKPAPKGD
jgi:mannose-6-phosphate isomerase-like protein (cupin superfamily)